MKDGEILKKICLFLGICFLLVGCGKYTLNDAKSDLENRLSNIKSYKLSGEMEIVNNDDVYKYDVDVAYAKTDKFRVSLKNKTNNHEQIILKNADGVYVLTPNLNKSFKFQSDWPYNNSQVYLLQTLLSDIQNDKSSEFKNNGKNYVFKTSVNYPNNSDLVKQNIYFDSKLNPVKVEVMNADGDVLIRMTFKEVNLKAKVSNDTFILDSNMKVSTEEDKSSAVSKIDEEIYPMYIPASPAPARSQEKYLLHSAIPPLSYPACGQHRVSAPHRHCSAPCQHRQPATHFPGCPTWSPYKAKNYFLFYFFFMLQGIYGTVQNLQAQMP